MTKTKNILYVEDDNLISEGFIMFFEKYYNIIHASNGLEAVEKFKSSSNLDLIITDISMPIINGIDLIKQIRKSNKKILIYAFTALPDSNKLLNEKSKITINRIIPKPFDIKVLKNFIDKDLK